MVGEILFHSVGIVSLHLFDLILASLYSSNKEEIFQIYTHPTIQLHIFGKLLIYVKVDRFVTENSVPLYHIGQKGTNLLYQIIPSQYLTFNQEKNRRVK